jgi:integrase
MRTLVLEVWPFAAQGVALLCYPVKQHSIRLKKLHRPVENQADAHRRNEEADDAGRRVNALRANLFQDDIGVSQRKVGGEHNGTDRQRHHGEGQYGALGIFYGPMSMGMLRGRFDLAREAAGVAKSEFQMRDLRAKAGTDKAESSGDILQARDQLGHTTVVMTEQYIRNRKGKKVSPTK